MDRNNIDGKEFRVNIKGHVRPKQYRSKYRRMNIDENDILPKQSGLNSSEMDVMNELPIADTCIVQNESVTYKWQQQSGSSVVSDIESNHICEKKCEQEQEINFPQNTSTEKNEKAIETESFLPDMETTFIDFIRHREETCIDDLMKTLEEENNLQENDIDDEEFFEEGNNEILVNDDDPIQPGHFLSIKSSVLMIWLYIITHSLTSIQITDLLKLLNLHMMISHPALKSLYCFKRFFQNMKAPFIKHFYCSFCNYPVGEKEQNCKNDYCGRDLTNPNSKEYFLELSIATQLQSLFSRNEFYENLSYPSKRIKTLKRNIEDIYDGCLYKNTGVNNVQSPENEHTISFIFNTDGIPIFKSSKMSLWPIFLMVNELPYRLRKNRENMILCGLWFGQKKPDMNIFCNHVLEDLLKLEKGMEIKPVINGNEKTITVRGFLLGISCDIPARNSTLNMNQHNGSSCCPKCVQTGSNFRTTTGGNVRIFPYQQIDPAGPERSSRELLDDAEKARETSVAVNGIKGPSFLMFCPLFHSVKGIAIDSMHLVYLGVMRTLMKLWFNVSHGLQAFSIYKYVDIVDARITTLKPPHTVSRTPRSISEHIKFWKAAEFRSWFFYYSIPCIFDLLPPKYLYHYCALLEAVYLLNKESISEQDIEKSERLLQYFVFMVPSLYGERYLTINFHSLLHLPETVRNLGPLWCTSCFAFESANGDLLKLFHGTQYIDIQIINAVHIFQTLPSLSKVVDVTSPAYPLIQSLLKTSKCRKDVLSLQTYGVGYKKNIDNSFRLQLAIC